MLLSRAALRPIAFAGRIRWQSSLASSLAGLNGRHFLSIDELRYVQR